MNSLIQQMHEDCAKLRFAEGLRRRSAEARAEATIREACGVASYSGARVAPAQLRQAIMDWKKGQVVAADMAVALGNWQALWTIVSRFPGLNDKNAHKVDANDSTPLPAQLASIQRDYGAFLVRAGLCAVDEVSIPRSTERWSQMLEYLRAEVSPTTPSAVVSAARVWGLFLVEEPFHVGNELMGIGLAKQILARSGVEPTAVALLSAYGLQAGSNYGEILAQLREGQWDPWIEFVVSSVSFGCGAGLEIARLVQAGQSQLGLESL